MIELRKEEPSVSLSCEYLMCTIELRKEESGVSLSHEYLIGTIKQNLLYTQIIEICDQVVSTRPITY